MLSRRRILTATLAVGGLTMLGTGGASAAVAGPAVPVRQPVVAAPAASPQANPPEGGEAPGPTHPFCEGGSPLLGTPFCPSQWPPS